jgi:signal transduction histidine kinase
MMKTSSWETRRTDPVEDTGSTVVGRRPIHSNVGVARTLAAPEMPGPPPPPARDRPRVRLRPEAPHIARLVGARSKARPRAVVVDDDPSVVEGLALQLRRTYEVEAFSDPFIARNRLLGGPPLDAVIADMRMPGLTGVDVLRAAKKHVPEAARVLLTGYTDFGAAVAAVNDAAVHRFLTKPCRPEDLLRSVEEARALAAASRPAEAGAMDRVAGAATLGTMAGTIGHEIKNLVAALHGSLDIVREQIARGELPATEEVGLLGLVETRLREHAHALTHLAKPRERRSETLELDRIVVGALELMRRAGFLRGAAVDIEGSVVSPVRGDPALLEGAFLNLFKNASEALTTRARTEAERPRSTWSPRLSIVLCDDGDSVTCIIEDNGCGMSQETLARLGERYYTTKGAEGTGVGFSILRSSIRAHGGSLRVVSKENELTRVTLTLPAKR